MSFALKSITLTVPADDTTGLKNTVVKTADYFNLGDREKRGNRTALAKVLQKDCHDLGNQQGEI